MEENKLDLILVELQKIFNQIEDKFNQVDQKFEQIDKRFEQIDKRFEQIDKKFEQIDKRFEQIDKKFEQIDKRFEQIDKRLDGIDARITKFEEENKAEHKVMFNMLNTLTSAFLRFEAEQTQKINYLLEADKDRKDHQNIYAIEFTKLNDLVRQNSFRISNLEKNQ